MVDERDIDPQCIETSCGSRFLRSPILAIPERFALMRRSRRSVIACFGSFIMILELNCG